VSDATLSRVRAREYPDPPQGIFLNAASWGIVPKSAAEEAADLMLRRNRTHGFEEAELGAIQRRCRRAIAALISVDPSEVALAPNTSFGVGLAAALLREGEPGVIVLSEGEFPANVLPFKALEPYGFEVCVVPADAAGLPDEERMIAALDLPSVRALTVSAVQFATGYQADLARLGQACRERGVLYFVDAIQALGVAPFSPTAISADIVASGGQKWLCSPWGSGFVWVRPELRGSFQSPMVSWLAMDSGARFDDMLHYRMDWRSNARKFELATLGIQDYLGLARSVEILMEVGIEAIADHVQELHAPLLEWIESRPDAEVVTPTHPLKRAGIITFRPPDVDSAVEALRAERVIFSVRQGSIRLSPHFYNTLDEMEEVVRLLDSLGGC
jgi:selenocysteine lyase/cysteine desulfurase